MERSVGNYGVPEHYESAKVQIAGLVVSELALAAGAAAG